MSGTSLDLIGRHEFCVTLHTPLLVLLPLRTNKLLLNCGAEMSSKEVQLEDQEAAGVQYWGVTTLWGEVWKVVSQAHPQCRVSALPLLNLRPHCKLLLMGKFLPFIKKKCYWHKNFSFFHFQSTVFNLPKSLRLSSQKEKTMQQILIEFDHFHYFRNNFLLL